MRRAGRRCRLRFCSGQKQDGRSDDGWNTGTHTYTSTVHVTAHTPPAPPRMHDHDIGLVLSRRSSSARRILARKDLLDLLSSGAAAFFFFLRTTTTRGLAATGRTIDGPGGSHSDSPVAAHQ